MPTSDKITEELRAIFAVEAEEHVQALNGGLLALEAGGSEATIAITRDLFRAAHTLKGAARAVNLAEVEALAHQLEDLFEQISENASDVDRDVIQHGYQTVDAIAALIQAGSVREQSRSENESDETRKSDGSGPTDETVRVPTRKLDALLAHIGEITISRLGVEQRVADARAIETSLARWEAAQPNTGRASTRDDISVQTRRSLTRLRTALDADVRRLGQVLADLEQNVNSARLLPLAKILHPFHRMVRDLAKDTGKEIDLVLRGEHTEIDRSVLEQIKDPLVHLVRNCVEHGLEGPEERVRAGKPRRGTITISAGQKAERLVLEVADDGRGVSVGAVRREAIERGLLPSDAMEALSDDEVASLIFRPSLSTAPSLTELSGRGVGLDAVRDVVERLKGSVSFETTQGSGTAFSLVLPLVVSTVSSVLVQVARQSFALPLAAVERTLRIDTAGVVSAQGRETISVEGMPIVLASLADTLGLQRVDDDEPQGKRPAVVVIANGRRVAFTVDRVLETAEVVGKNLPQPLLRVRHSAGAAILGSGEVVVILNENDLVASAERGGGSSGRSIAPSAPIRASVLVVEDSITTRTLEKNILEAAGYAVMVAADGIEAWSVLQSNACDLVVADVEMPGMDGLALTEKIRSASRLRDLPVVLVTSRDSREDRERGADAGADAYIVKGAFDQERLLDTIRRLL